MLPPPKKHSIAPKPHLVLPSGVLYNRRRSGMKRAEAAIHRHDLSPSALDFPTVSLFSGFSNDWRFVPGKAKVPTRNFRRPTGEYHRAREKATKERMEVEAVLADLSERPRNRPPQPPFPTVATTASQASEALVKMNCEVLEALFRSPPRPQHLKIYVGGRPEETPRRDSLIENAHTVGFLVPPIASVEPSVPPAATGRSLTPLPPAGPTRPNGRRLQ
eukprot:Sspe_Gene.96376::Locus_69045_Transcript_1_1_Confidence_1.000_Length_987::g.96376::m.96376